MESLNQRSPARIWRPRPRAVVWLMLPTILWLAFVWWYSNTAGPLQPHETDALATQMADSGADAAAVARMRQFMETDTGKPFYMVNLLHMAGNGPDEMSADEAMDRYMAHMLPAMLKRASHPIFVGPVTHTAMDLVGIDGAEVWSSVGIVRYRSRRDILEIALDPIFDDKHAFKVAALAKTIAVPVEPVIPIGDLRWLTLPLLLLFYALVLALRGRRWRD